MNTFSLVFSIIGIVAMVFMVAAGPTIATHQAFAYGGYGDYGGYPYGGYGGYPYGGNGDPPFDYGSSPYDFCSYADFKKNVPLYGDCGYYPFGY
jgi:hypothetical protein